MITCLILLAVAAPTRYKLVWSDEFNKEGSPDLSEWRPENGFVRNKEDQLYRPENLECKSGCLVIEARREDLPNPSYSSDDKDWRRARKLAHYTSGSMVTNRSWLYGRFEMRAKYNIDSGLWPAFWSVGSAREWPDCGEIDVMEFYRRQLLANFAWGSDKRWSARWNSKATPIDQVAELCGQKNGEDWAARFHTWRMDWDPAWIRIYVDGHLLNSMDLTQTINKDPAQTNPFHEPQHFILNLAIGGANGGDPEQTKFPQQFLVDWVRVYQSL